VKPELVKPETALFLEKSHELLERADTMMVTRLDRLAHPRATC
jgi:hypothetical protein